MKRILLACLAGLLTANPVNADDDWDDDYYSEHDLARDALGRGAALPLATILAIAGRYQPGDIIDVDLDEEDGRLVYELKVLTRSGQVREIHLDARDGALLKIEDD
ncbi:PepSY domain-containing protein [Iodidimonas sp. SYSU 1G8]|uniref:PepSY domain-containing protein n=1 Tax=Iodidimonas sp. SYSU 1G8 TaxID=3133967 RepID=UPI0031FF1621